MQFQKPKHSRFCDQTTRNFLCTTVHSHYIAMLHCCVLHFMFNNKTYIHMSCCASTLSLNRQPQNKLHSKSALLCIFSFSALCYAAASSPQSLFSTLLCLLLRTAMPFLYIGNTFLRVVACSPLLSHSHWCVRILHLCTDTCFPSSQWKNFSSRYMGYNSLFNPHKNITYITTKILA